MRRRGLVPGRNAAWPALVGTVLLAACGSGATTAQRPARGLPVAASLTRCTTATARARGLNTSAVAMTRVAAGPFGVAVNQSGTAFVSAGQQVGSYRPGVAGRWALTTRQRSPGGFGLGETLADAGRYLLVADAGDGARVFAVHGDRLTFVGTLAGSSHQGGAIEVAVTRDGDYAFVSLEDSKVVAVFALHRALASAFGPADYVGTIPVGIAPVGLSVSPDGRWLYVTSELESEVLPGQSALRTPGTLTVVSVSRAETDPAGAVVTTVSAGCQPVRVITSASGSVVWVTARASDAVLGFSARRLRTDPRRALIAAVRVGEAPVGLALVRGGSRIVVANSNRFGVAGARATLAVVSVPRALSGGQALLGYLPAGQFPREMAVTPDGLTLLVTDYGSGQLESVRVPSLP